MVHITPLEMLKNDFMIQNSLVFFCFDGQVVYFLKQALCDKHASRDLHGRNAIMKIGIQRRFWTSRSECVDEG